MKLTPPIKVKKNHSIQFINTLKIYKDEKIIFIRGSSAHINRLLQ